MWKEDRLHRIRGMLSTFQQVTTDSIAAELGVSRETARRDIIQLEEAGELRRVHGGAVLDNAEPPFAERTRTRVGFKRAIARQVAREVRSGQTLFLDAGSTTAIVAEELAKLSGLTIITNSFDVALHMNAVEGGALQRSNRTVVLGGYLHHSLPATFGERTILEIHRYHVDMALLSPVGIEATSGATTFDFDEAEVARAMVANATHVTVLADYSKVGLISRVGYCPSERVDRLITNSRAADHSTVDELRRQSVAVAFAD